MPKLNALAALLLCVSWASAASESEESKASSQSSDGLDEIIVTGRRAQFDALGNAEIVNVPFSITAISAADIQRAQYETLADLTKLMPSAYVESEAVGAGSKIAVRGDTLSILLVDGFAVYGTNVGGPFDIPFEPFEQVQILNGPSSFYFGLSGGGGVANYITKRPTSDEHRQATMGFSSDSVAYTAVDLSDTMGWFGYRFNAAEQNGTESTRQTHVDRNTLSLALDFHLGDRTLITLDSLYSRLVYDKVIYSIGLDYGTSATDPQLPFLPPISGHMQLAGPNAEQYYRQEGSTLTLHHDFNDNISFKVASAYYEFQNLFTSLASIAENPQGDISSSSWYGLNTLDHNFNADALLSAHFDTGPLNHNLSVGGLYSYKLSFTGLTADGEAYPYGQAGGATNLYDGYVVPDTPAGFEIPSLSRKVRSNLFIERSAFFSDDISFGEHWKAIAGLRYFSFDNTAYGQATTTAKKPTPAVALMFKPQITSTYYASYEEGYANGGYALNPLAAGGYGLDAFPLVKTQQAEVGYKWESTHLSASSALFQTTKLNSFYYYDYTLLNEGLATLPDMYVLPGGKIRRRGIEASVLSRLSPEWSLFMGGSFIRTKNVDVPNTIALEDPVGQLLYKARIDYSPHWAEGLSLYAFYNAVGAGAPETGGSLVVPGYKTVDVGSNYKLKFLNQEFNARFAIDNVFDEKYWIVNDSGPNPGVPRTLKVTVSMNF